MKKDARDQQIANQQAAITALQDELAAAKADIARAAEAERTLNLSLADAESRYAAAELEAIDIAKKCNGFEESFRDARTECKRLEGELEQVKSECDELRDKQSRKVIYLTNVLTEVEASLANWKLSAVYGWAAAVLLTVVWALQ